ncbi:uncharacterized protein LOC110362235 isoform X2 [Columba livia]|uniref:uncharacterized protein LOC110362235 isoform X2 n=1 Tax=Columba livia TaxID=8932 RepID=UPI0031BA0A68
MGSAHSPFPDLLCPQTECSGLRQINHHELVKGKELWEANFDTNDIGSVLPASSGLLSERGASNHNLKFPHCLSNNVSVPSLVNRTEQRACFDFNFSPSLFHCFVQTCRITELVRLEGTSGDDLLHSPCFDELHEILVCPFLQPVEVSLNGIITSWCINQPFQLVCLANLLRVHCTPSSTSLMKRLNSTGPCIDL